MGQWDDLYEWNKYSVYDYCQFMGNRHDNKEVKVKKSKDENEKCDKDID